MANSSPTITIAARDIVAFVVEWPAVAADLHQTMKRAPRTHRTGRNQQFNLKAKPETVDLFYAMADAHGVTLAELLELALGALQEKGKRQDSPGKVWRFPK